MIFKGCKSGKVLYGDERRAAAAAALCIQRGILSDMQIYFCKDCRHYHLRTARVQLHDWLWKPMEFRPFKVRDWFRQRGTIDQWDND